MWPLSFPGSGEIGDLQEEKMMTALCGKLSNNSWLLYYKRTYSRDVSILHDYVFTSHYDYNNGVCTHLIIYNHAINDYGQNLISYITLA